MSGYFNGFSEADIIKLATKNPTIKQLDNQNAVKTSVNLNGRRRSSESRRKIRNDKVQAKCNEPIPETAKLSKPPEVTAFVDNTKVTPNVENADKNKSDVTTEGPIKKINLEEFEVKQKLIEEQNRKRKELLAKALAIRTKQTHEETQKLNKIREEFKKLDDLLFNDVNILRKQIEAASVDYMETQKRYYKIEKEFLDSKMALHKKLEHKEMLTEHLCTIIEKNEERKAEKLNELLSKLNLSIDTVCTDNSSTEKSAETEIERHLISENAEKL